MSEIIKKYDENNNLIYFKDEDGFEEWRKFDDNRYLMYYKLSDDYEHWYMYSDLGRRIEITEKEYKEIEFRKKEKEYLSREKCSRFEIMDI